MHHARKHANQYDPAFIVLLCSGCHHNVRKVYALHVALGASASEKRSFSRSRARSAGEARHPNSPRSESDGDVSLLLVNKRITGHE